MMDGLIDHCRETYQRTAALWKSLEGSYPTWKCRYSILYAPPIHRPELLILGANPGYNPADLYDEEILTWPQANEYVIRDWPLARKLRSIFLNAGIPDLLERSVGSNVLFFKSKSLGRHESGLGWKDNPPEVRTCLEMHCRREIGDLIRVLEPKAILTLGLSVFDDFAEKADRMVAGSSGRRVAAVGQTNDVKVLGIIHPTGAQVSAADWRVVTSVIASEMGGHGAIGQAPNAFVGPEPSSKPTRIREMSKMNAPSRQRPFRPSTIVGAKEKPPATFGYQPIHDFWQELSKIGPVTVEDFHSHMISIGWRRPQGKELTYEVTRTDVASMCKNGFAERMDD